ncbi:MAG: PepSY domain-containing protein [Rhizobiaceae bacterium]|nr:PepSY domain-containing protein [Rhizobiaceae bacterium]MCO5073079.1 PepSY domain-containing protein [Rhizobiaceae bacterium]
MKKLLVLSLSAFAASSSFVLAASKCDVPLSDWKPREELQAKLKAEGWEVRSIKTEDGCYEAYAMDANGKRVEAYFNPQTFERVDKPGGEGDEG